MITTMVQLNYRVGDLDSNTNKITESLMEIAKDSIPNNLIVFSELCLTGYPPLDLLHRPGFIDKQMRCLNEIREFISHNMRPDCHVVIGLATPYSRGKRGLRNSVVVINGQGEVVHEYHKQALPDYNIFNESRYFDPGKQNTTIKLYGKNIGLFICEDLWFEGKGSPTDQMHKSGDFFFQDHAPLDLIVSVNASPINQGKLEDRLNLFRHLSKEKSTAVAYVNQVGSNDEICFDGGSFYCDRGELVSVAKSFEEDILSVDLENPRSNEYALAGTNCSYTNYAYLKSSFSIYVRSFISSNPEIMPSCIVQKDIDMVIEAALYYEIIKMGIKDYVEKSGSGGVVVSSSGGIDSAVVAAMAVEALGPEKVDLITLPSQYSSAGSVDDSAKLADNLGATLYREPIEDKVYQAKNDFRDAYGKELEGVALENVQARIRGTSVMAYSNDQGKLVLSCGNKSEMSVGYFTLYGDSNGALSPLGDLYKMEVYALAKYINMRNQREVIPVEIINKAPSAELAPGQVDTNSLPDYRILDSILRLYIESDQMSAEELISLKYDINVYKRKGALSDEEVERVIKLVDRSEFKRRQAPIILRCNRRSFGQGRVLPVAQNAPLTFEV
jgi:NAD+ synthase (glutamine-hydrolysing)